MIHENAIIIVAGGSGQRFGGNVPKQFRLLNGLPVLMHTVSLFQAAFSAIKIILVIPESQQFLWRDLCEKHQFIVPHSLVYGGDTRFYSVKNGLAEAENSKFVGVHDAVRPLLSKSLVHTCYETAKRRGSCVPVVPVRESLRRGSYQHNESVDRTDMYTVQTPQVFRQDWLTDAYNKVFSNSLTDDASVVEAAGYPVFLTEGELQNIKITQPVDLQLAEFYKQKI